MKVERRFLASYSSNLHRNILHISATSSYSTHISISCNFLLLTDTEIYMMHAVLLMMAEVEGIKMMKAVESQLAVSRGAAVRRRRRVPPVRGSIKRKIFALVYKKLKLASQHILLKSQFPGCARSTAAASLRL